MGSAKRRPTVVSRAYRPSADNCARALELLLTIKKAAEPSRPTAVTTRRDQSMIRATTSIPEHDPPALLGDLRLALSLRPQLADHPRRLASHLKAEEQDVRQCLEAIRDEREEVLA